MRDILVEGRGAGSRDDGRGRRWIVFDGIAMVPLIPCDFPKFLDDGLGPTFAAAGGSNPYLVSGLGSYPVRGQVALQKERPTDAFLSGDSRLDRR